MSKAHPFRRTLAGTMVASALSGLIVPSHAIGEPRIAPAGGGDGDGIPPKLGEAPLSLLRRLPVNEVGRDFIAGDLGGCYELLMQLLERVQFDRTKDRVICTGNLINHGPDSQRCLSLLREPWFFAVAGDHEELLLQAAGDSAFDWSAWVARGGTWATTLTKDELLDLADLVANLPLAIAVGEGAERYNVIHAEFHGPDEALDDVLEHGDTGRSVPLSLTRGRDLVDGKAHAEHHEGLSLTFCGHTPVSGVSRIGSHVFINTGAYLAQRGEAGHCLSMVEVKTGQVWQTATLH